MTLLRTGKVLSRVRAPCAGPLAEIDFWRERNAVLSSLYEQLNLPSVRRMCLVVEHGSGDQNLLTSFRTQFNELKKVGSPGPIACRHAAGCLSQHGGYGSVWQHRQRHRLGGPASMACMRLAGLSASFNSVPMPC